MRDSNPLLKQGYPLQTKIRSDFRLIRRAVLYNIADRCILFPLIFRSSHVWAFCSVDSNPTTPLHPWVRHGQGFHLDILCRVSPPLTWIRIGICCTIPVCCIIAYCVTDSHRLHRDLMPRLAPNLIRHSTPIPGCTCAVVSALMITLYRLTPSSIHTH